MCSSTARTKCSLSLGQTVSESEERQRGYKHDDCNYRQHIMACLGDGHRLHEVRFKSESGHGIRRESREASHRASGWDRRAFELVKRNPSQRVG